MLMWAETCSCRCIWIIKSCVRRLSASNFDSIFPWVHRTTLISTQSLGLQSAVLRLSLDALRLPSASLRRQFAAHVAVPAERGSAQICNYPKTHTDPWFSTRLSRIARVYDFTTNDAGYNKMYYKIAGVQMLATLDRAKPRTQNTGGLKLGTVRLGTVQMAGAVVTAIAKRDRTPSVYTVYTVQCGTAVTVKTNWMNWQF
jgi:hypothetical protein